jgi:uncharacterized protein YndB with AHSA1/START domain
MPWDLHAVGPDFLETAPHRYVHTAVIRQPPERVFDAIGRSPDWGGWFPGFDHTGRWLTEGPPHPGSRRRVRMTGLTFDETVLAWEAPGRFAFRVDRSTAPMASAMAEDYRITGHPSGSALEWVLAIEPFPILRPALALLDPALSRLLRRIATNLEQHLQT